MDKVLGALPTSIGSLLTRLLAGSDDAARSGRGALLAFSIRIAAAAFAFISQILLARWMGAHEFGIYTYMWVWLCVVAVLAPLGTSSTVIRFLPQYLEQGRHALARGFLRFGRYVSGGAGLICAVIGTVILLAAPDLVPEHYRTPLIFAIICLPGFAMIEFMDGFGRAQNRLDLALVPGYMLRPLLVLMLVGLAAAAGTQPSAQVGVAALAAATWAAAGLQYVLQHKQISDGLTAGPRDYDLRLWTTVSLPVLAMESFSLFMMNFDILVLEVFVEPEQIGIYFAAVRTISLVAFIHFAVSAAVMSRFSAAHARGDGEAIRSLLRQARKWTLWPSALGILGLLVLGKPLLWLFGPEFTAGYPVMFILAIGILARAAAGPSQGLLVVTGHQNITAVVMFAAVVLNGGLNLLLIPQYGLTGAASATAAAFALEALTLFIVANRVSRPPASSETAQP